MTSVTVERRAARMCARFGHLPRQLAWQTKPIRLWKSTGEVPAYFCRRCHDVVELPRETPSPSATNG